MCLKFWWQKDKAISRNINWVTIWLKTQWDAYTPEYANGSWELRNTDFLLIATSHVNAIIEIVSYSMQYISTSVGV